MIQRDYILRMIEEIGKFLAKLSGLKDKEMGGKGYDEFLTFLNVHFKIAEENLSLENLDLLEEKLKVAFANYPDELGQLLSGGAEIAKDTQNGRQAEAMYLLAWRALKKAENDTQTFRFDRQVEMSTIKDKLGLMGINVE